MAESAEGMGMSRSSLWRWVVIGLLLYSGLSVACSVAHDVPAVRALIDEHWALVWLLGPPGSLLYQGRGIAAYLAESVVFFACVTGTVYGLYREWAGFFLFGLAAVATWLVSGFFVYVSTM